MSIKSKIILGFSFVQGISHRNDAMALWFYCELARKERHKAMTSKTLSLGLNKRVFSIFVNRKHRVLQVTLKFSWFFSRNLLVIL